MSESPRGVEGDRSFTSYFATTVENFRTCAVIEKERVYFDKSLEPRHVDSESVQYLHGLAYGTHIAALRAKELNHTPAILQGQLDKKFSQEQELPKGSRFPVDYIHVPREGANWDDFSLVHDSKEVNKVYERKNALEFLNELNQPK